MIFGMLFLVASAFGSDPIERPFPIAKSKFQCIKSFGITKGVTVPSEVAQPSGIARCSGVLVPISEFADLLATERWAVSLEMQYKLDVSELERERDWYKKKLDFETKPKPFWERPSSQRWLGRLETIVVVGIVTAGLGATYYYSSGAGK
mgnify:CR=1 FL=1|jgi:hypothetical protein|tara:strand:+ start:419 stop:865 length:447 start_codon:yes stop_codon:yes gene_type:complete